MAGDGEDAVAGDAGEGGVGQGRSVEDAVADDEDVFAGALADQAADVQGNALVVAVDFGFHADEL